MESMDEGSQCVLIAEMEVISLGFWDVDYVRLGWTRFRPGGMVQPILGWAIVCFEPDTCKESKIEKIKIEKNEKETPQKKSGKQPPKIFSCFYFWDIPDWGLVPD